MQDSQDVAATKYASRIHNRSICRQRSSQQFHRCFLVLNIQNPPGAGVKRNEVLTSIPAFQTSPCAGTQGSFQLQSNTKLYTHLNVFVAKDKRFSELLLSSEDAFKSYHMTINMLQSICSRSLGVLAAEHDVAENKMRCKSTTPELTC